MNCNAKEMLTKVRRHFRESTAARWSDAELLDDMHEEICDIQDDVRQTDQNAARWFVKPYTFTTVNGTVRYSMPPDFIGIDKLALRQNSIDWPLKPCPYDERWIKESAAGSFGPNDWSGYTVAGSFVELWPIPSTAETIKVEYDATPPRLVTGKLSTVAYSGGYAYGTMKFSVPTSLAKIAGQFYGTRVQMLSTPIRNEVAYCISQKASGSAVFSGFSASPGAGPYATWPELPATVARLVEMGTVIRGCFKLRDFELQRFMQAQYDRDRPHVIGALLERVKTHPDQVPGLRSLVDFDGF